MEKGKLEGEKAKATEIARKMLSLGIDVETVIKATGLTMEEIQALRDKL